MVIGQGAKPGGGGMLLGQKVSERVAAMRTLPPGIDQRSASRHPDWTGPDDLRIKIEELREATGWEKPVYVKLGATRVEHDVKLAVAAGADVVVVDGLQGGTGATQTVFIEHAGIPTLPGGAHRRRGAARDRQAGRGPARSLRRDPLRGRRGQGPRARRRRRCRSASPRCSPSAATGPPTARAARTTTPRPTTPRSAPRPASATTATPASARSGVTTQDPGA